MLTSGDVLVLTYEDVVEGLLSGAVLSIPSGMKRLVIHQDAISQLNDDLGLSDEDQEDSQ